MTAKATLENGGNGGTCLHPQLANISFTSLSIERISYKPNIGLDNVETLPVLPDVSYAVERRLKCQIFENYAFFQPGRAGLFGALRGRS